MKSFLKIMTVPALMIAGSALLAGGHTFAGPVVLLSAFGYAVIVMMG